MQRIEFLFSILFCIVMMPLSRSQTYKELKIKEHYDDIYIGAYEYPPAIDFFDDLATDDDHANLGQHGGPMESMLIMYETTKDKAYLYKFMEWTVGLFEIRGFSHSFLEPSLYL